MAARITACILQKGGTGKSSTAHALSAGLIARGYRVLVCDLDAQGNISQSMRANTSNKGLFEALNGEPIIDLIQTTEQGDILASSQRLTIADKTFVEFGMEYLLSDALSQVKNAYDYIILDCPPHLGVITANALVAATDLIIPITSDMYAMSGLSLLLTNIEKVKMRANPELRIDGILLTKFSNRSVLSRDLKEAIEAKATEMRTKVYNSFIRESVSVREAQAQRMNIFEYAPESNPAKDYANFISEYLGEGGSTNGS
jgi:chromosome partitioning protein